MSTSGRGRAFLERHEGVVLKAYRDPVGIWTIGAGLTAASGVVRPRGGMVITRREADRLLAAALATSYEPAVRKAMSGAKQHEFDAGVSFHWNTGAIGRASWVKAWSARQWQAVHDGLLRWTRGGGRVLPGLKRRREEEFRLMREGLYDLTLPTQGGRMARIALPIDPDELLAIRTGFRKLGYDPGADDHHVARDAVERFQKDHDLTVDGILGRATLSTLQRRLDARAKTAGTAVSGTAGAGATQVPGLAEVVPDDNLLLAVGAITAVALVLLAWKYRDVLAVKVQRAAPSIAAWLRNH